MQDNDIKQKLKHLYAPPPAADAKERALAAAMQAFEAEQHKKAKTRQGSVHFHRPIHATFVALEQMIGRFFMQRTYVYAGSLAALAVVLMVTTTHYSTMVETVVPPPVQTAQPAAQPEPVKTEPPVVQAQIEPQVPVQAEAPQVQPIPEAEKIVAAKEKKQAPAAIVQSAPTVAASPPPPPPVASADSSGRVAEYSVGMSAGDIAGASAVMKVAPGMPAPYYIPPQDMTYMPPVSGDKFDAQAANPVKITAQEPVSTFSIDVDTASYSFVRRMINGGQLPPKDAVRVEEMINYFGYDYALPESKEQPFKPTVAVYQTPWNADTKLVHIGIKGYDISKADKPHANLVFLIDVSGSMNQPDKLPLVKTSLKMLVEQMGANDTIGIVTYAGYSGVALEPTKVSDKQKILSVIDSLGAGGGTAGAAGIQDAYRLAEAHFDKNGVNRVILATDGDFNVGVASPQELKTLIEQKRTGGVFLSILGFGRGNYNDALMQTLAQNGNGNAAYIDNLNEARKVLVEEAGSTLFTIAKDVKLQVEFNPALVSEYRLIGYESRMLKREDFNNDKVDAGEVGAGHAVTAIYEITPAGSKSRQSDPLRYGSATPEKKPETHFAGEYGFLKIRYKLPKETESKLITTPIAASLEKDVKAQPDDIRFAASVAAFGQMLRGDTSTKGFTYDDVATLAESAKGKDSYGYRAEFVNLVRLAKSLQPSQPQSMPVE